MTPRTTLVVDDVRVVLGGRPALVGVSCVFEPGWTAIVGPNGAGKSTLLRVAAGLRVPTSGRATIDGVSLGALPARERGRRIAWFAERDETSGDLAAREIVALGRLPHLGLIGATGPRDDEAIDRAMTRTGCLAWRDRLLVSLSGGERQRVLLARALATEASTLLLDEPTTHLDWPHQVALIRLVRELAATHTVVTVLHDLAFALLADRVVVLDRGALRIAARPDDPRLHAALVDVFDGAIRIDVSRGRPTIVPEFDDEVDASTTDAATTP